MQPRSKPPKPPPEVKAGRSGPLKQVFATKSKPEVCPKLNRKGRPQAAPPTHSSPLTRLPPAPLFVARTLVSAAPRLISALFPRPPRVSVSQTVRPGGYAAISQNERRPNLFSHAEGRAHRIVHRRQNLPTAALLQRGAWHAGVLVLVRYPQSRIPRFYFGPDIRDAATPDFIDPLFCAKTYPF